MVDVSKFTKEEQQKALEDFLKQKANRQANTARNMSLQRLARELIKEDPKLKEKFDGYVAEYLKTHYKS